MKPKTNRTNYCAQLAFVVAISTFATNTPATAQFIVDNLGDVGDDTAGDGNCDINGGTVVVGDCTLRAAVEESNVLGGEQTITFGVSGIFALTLGQIEIADDLMISGQSRDLTVIRQDTGLSSIFSTSVALPNVTLRNLTLSEAERPALSSRAGTTVMVQSCSFLDNAISGTGGGAVSTQGTVAIEDTVFARNSAPSAGAIAINGASGAHVTIRDSLLTNNEAIAGFGGAISMDVGAHTLIVEDTELTDNKALLGSGGAIAGNGYVSLLRTVMSGNQSGSSASHGGGALHYQQVGGGAEVFELSIEQTDISNNSTFHHGGGANIVSNGAVTILRSAIYNNSTQAFGGGIAIGNSGTNDHIIANSTISGNTAPVGGGIDTGGDVLLSHVTVFGNTGGGLDAGTGLELVNSIIAHATGAGDGPDCAGAAIIHTGPNLDSDTTCNASLTATDPLLGILGPSSTHPLLNGSPAIDTANGTVCAAAPILGIDQRAVPRPLGPECDLGAHEGGIALLFSDGFESGDTTMWSSASP